MPKSTSLLLPSSFDNFGKLLKYLRRRACLSQRDLSIAVGYSESQISRFESNHRPPDLSTLGARFAPALYLEHEPEFVARLLELAAVARGDSPADLVISARSGRSANTNTVADVQTNHRSRLLNNLPGQLTNFVGRETESADIKRLLSGTPAEAVRLVTLTGVGGIGKTRLALEVATDLLDEFSNGICLVELAPVSNPALLSQTLATVLGLPEIAGYPLLRTVADYLRPLTLLLILDNCEHLIEACAEIAEVLLRACPHLKMLATSREALGLLGETIFPVPPLSLPPASAGFSVGTVKQSEALRLFVDRARAVQPDFQMTDSNVATLAHLCQQLDGLPLAIELAAARMRALSVDQIASRLDDRFRLLAGGNRTALPRHQTLSALISWSYELLPDLERSLLARLSVFRGGWTLEAAEAVCAGGEVKAALVLGLLMRLVDKSFVMVEEQGHAMRYRLLETIRQYAWIKALESGETQAMQGHFYDYYLRLAEEAEPKLKTAEQLVWLNGLGIEHDNFRAALDWALHSSPDQPESGLRLAAALEWFWYVRGSWSEARDWLEEVLAQGNPTDPAGALLRARVLTAVACLASCQGAEARATAALEESQALCHETGDIQALAFSLAYLGEIRAWQDHPELAEPLLERSIALFTSLRAAGTWGQALALKFLAEAVLFQRDYARADALFLHSLSLFRQLGDRWALASALEGYGVVAVRQGDYVQAKARLKEGLALHQVMRYSSGWAHVFNRLARPIHEARMQGDHERVSTLLAESLALARDLGHEWGMSESLRHLATAAGTQGRPDRAARLLGAAEVMREASGEPVPPYPFRVYERDVARVREALGSETFTTAWTDGRAMTIEQAIAYALEGI